MNGSTHTRGAAAPSPEDLSERLIRQLVADADGEVEEVRELVDLYLEASAARVATIRAAHAAKDPTAVKFAAHDLKSSSGAFGAFRVSRAAAQLEADARAGVVSDAVVLEAEAAFAEAAPAIRRLMATLASG